MRRAGDKAAEEVVVTRSPEETEALGVSFSAQLKSGDCVGLVGELGAGKTRFVKGIATGLGSRGLVKSPTFTIVSVYGGGRLVLNHVDLYRIDKEADVWDIGLEEFIYGKGATVIEWADRAGRLLPEGSYLITFKHAGNDQREIRISRPA